MKEIKRVHHFVLIMTPSLCDVSIFCIFLLLTLSCIYLSLEIFFPDIWLVFYVSAFYVTLKVFSLCHINSNFSQFRYCMSVWNLFRFSSTSQWWKNINNSGYPYLGVDHPNNIKRGGVYMYFKEFLPLIRRSDLCNVKECLVTQINVTNEKCFLQVYKLRSQRHEELESFYPQQKSFS